MTDINELVEQNLKLNSYFQNFILLTFCLFLANLYYSSLVILLIRILNFKQCKLTQAELSRNGFYKVLDCSLGY